MLSLEKVYVVAKSVISPLGLGTAIHHQKIKDGESGVKKQDAVSWTSDEVWASVITPDQVNEWNESSPLSPEFSALEKYCIWAIKDALSAYDENVLKSEDTLFLFSSTKGNIDTLGTSNESVYLWHTAQKIARYFHHPNQPIIVSNACISGTLALEMAHRWLSFGPYTRAVVLGVDVFSEFVYSGFKVFMALSPGLCQPFDENRKGINLGEAAAVMVLEKSAQPLDKIRLAGGASSNDANHISGPSRTGDGLALAIEKALAYSDIKASQIQAISAHGTGTSYNDEMEAKAFALCHVEHAHVHSLKANLGHTLGAAGILETALAVEGMEQNEWLPSKGFENLGVSVPLHIATSVIQKPLQFIIKTASGFGSCNAALVLAKDI